MAKIEVRTDIMPASMESAVASGPFDLALEALTSRGYEVISLTQNAQLRIEQGPDFYVSRNANWTREGLIHIPRNGIFLTRTSPILENAVEATRSHREREGGERGRYYLSKEQLEQSLTDAVRIYETSIPVEAFGEEEITAYAFGQFAKQYGLLLKAEGISGMPIWLSDASDRPFVAQMWFRSLFDSSVLCGSNEDLSDDKRVRGVKPRTPLA